MKDFEEKIGFISWYWVGIFISPNRHVECRVHSQTLGLIKRFGLVCHLCLFVAHVNIILFCGWIWGSTLKKITIETALLIIRHFFLLLSTWGGVRQTCVINQISINVPSDPILLWLYFAHENEHESQLSPVFWQAFVNKSVEWMSMENVGKAKCSVPVHQLIVSTRLLWLVSVWAPIKDVIFQRQRLLT